jgi:predicted metal-dependent hydrolase
MPEVSLQNIDDFKLAVSEWARRIEVEPKEIHMRPMKNKWASLSESGRLTFNTELLDRERKFCNYVIVHELLHMKVPNHGKLFKSLMLAFLPDWEKCSKSEVCK